MSPRIIRPATRFGVVTVAPPRMTARMQAAMRDARRLISASGGFDGPRSMCMDVCEQGVRVYPSVYASGLAHQELEDAQGVSPFGHGPVGIVLILSDGHGEFLWARRSEELLVSPGCWSISVGGSVVPERAPRRVALDESFEELGLGAEQIHALRLQAVLLGAAPIGCMFVYSARIERDTPLAVDARETSAVAWAPTPDALPGRLAPMTRFVWRSAVPSSAAP